MSGYAGLDFSGMRVNVLYESGTKTVNPTLCECKGSLKDVNAEYCALCLRELTCHLRNRFFEFRRYAHGLAYRNYRCNCKQCYYYS